MGGANRGGCGRTCGPAALGLLLFSVPALSTATDFGYGLGYSAMHSDNMALAAIDPRADWLDIAKGELAFKESNLQNFSARVYSQLEYDDYQHQIFSNQKLFTLNSAATWMIKPQRLTWTAEDYYGQVPIVPFATVTPNNLQNVNVFTTGPNVFVRMDPLNTLELGARYDNFYAGVANSNSNRVGGIVDWLYQYSPLTVFSLNYQNEHAQYTQNVVASGYGRQDLFLRMDTHLRQTAWIGDLGETWLRQTGPGNIGGVYAKLQVSQQMTQTSAVSMSAASTITDTEDAILSAEQVGGIAGGTTVGTDIYRQSGINVTYTHNPSYGTDSITIFDQKLKYYTAPLDQQEMGESVSLGHQISGTLLATVFGSDARTRSYDTSIMVHDSLGGMRLTYEVRPDIFLGLEGQVTRQRSNVSAEAYSDKQILLSVSYYSNRAFVNSAAVSPPLMEQNRAAQNLPYSR